MISEETVPKERVRLATEKVTDQEPLPAKFAEQIEVEGNSGDAGKRKSR